LTLDADEPAEPIEAPSISKQSAISKRPLNVVINDHRRPPAAGKPKDIVVLSGTLAIRRCACIRPPKDDPHIFNVD